MLEKLPEHAPITLNYYFTQPWLQWLTKAWLFIATIGDHGTTAQRPVTNLFIGRTYFDDTLGLPVFIKSVSAGVAVWVNGAGSVV